MERWEKLIEGMDCFCVHAFEELRPLLPMGFCIAVCLYENTPKVMPSILSVTRRDTKVHFLLMPVLKTPPCSQLQKGSPG